MSDLDNLTITFPSWLMHDLIEEANKKRISVHDFVIDACKYAVWSNQPVKVAEDPKALAPWEQILKVVLIDMKSGAYPYPFKFESICDDNGGKRQCLIFGVRHVLQHRRNNKVLMKLCRRFGVESAVMFKKKISSVVLVKTDLERVFNGVFNGQRIAHLEAINIEPLAHLINLYKSDSF